MGKMEKPSNNIASRMHTLLHGDRLAQYKKEFVWDNAAVGAWIKSHVLHVNQRCPHVYRAWKTGGHSEKKQTLEFRKWLHTTLIGILTPLPSSERTRILLGETQNDIEASFYRQLQDDPLFWHDLPPSWAGQKGSEQRRAAEALGWKTSMTPYQIESAWDEELGQELSSFVYPHCLRVFKCFSDNDKNMRYRAEYRVAPSAVVIQGMSWATAEDVTLAQHLVAHSRWQSIITVVPHPNTLLLPHEASNALKKMVSSYAVLGLSVELARSIARGKLPAIDTVEQVELPDLGSPAF